MANKNVFPPAVNLNSATVPTTAGGATDALSAKKELAKIATAGSGDDLITVIRLSQETEPEYVAKLAVYASTQSFIKDLPALLCALLAASNVGLLKKVFPRVITRPQAVCTFVQIIRSGITGRRSLGSAGPRDLIRTWLEKLTDEQLSEAALTTGLYLGHVIALTHPKPATPAREALYGYILDNFKAVSKDYAQASSRRWKRLAATPLRKLPWETPAATLYLSDDAASWVTEIEKIEL